MKPRNEEREAAIKAGQLTYVDKNTHVDQRTKKSCGTFVRYANNGKCVACSKSNPRGHDSLAPAGVRLMFKDTPKSERMEAAVKTYVEHGANIMRCSFLYSLNNQDLGEELKLRGLTRHRVANGEVGYSERIDLKAKKVFNMAADVFAPKKRARDSHRGEA